MHISKDIRILTVDDGWKDLIEVKQGDFVFARVEGNKMIPSKVLNVIEKNYSGKVYNLSGRTINANFTSEQNFVLLYRSDKKNLRDKQFNAKIEDIVANRKKYNKNSIPRTAKWEANKKIEQIRFPEVYCKQAIHREKYSKSLIIDAKKFSALLGIYLAEGDCSDSGYSVRVSQANPAGKNLLRKLLPTISSEVIWEEIDNGFYTRDARLRVYFEPLGNTYTKSIPKEVKNLDPECLSMLVRWFAIGDGRIIGFKNGISGPMQSIKESLSLEEHTIDFGKGTKSGVFSVSKQLIDDLHECIVKIGMCCSREVAIAEKDYMFADRIIKAENKMPLYTANIIRDGSIYFDNRFMEISEYEYVGKAYGLEVECGSYYMEEGNKSFWIGC